jgi:hypothetical protein
MIAGIRSSGCEKRVFRHNDLAHLEELLAATDPDAPKLIAFESVYSMDRFSVIARPSCRNLQGRKPANRQAVVVNAV